MDAGEGFAWHMTGKTKRSLLLRRR